MQKHGFVKYNLSQFCKSERNQCLLTNFYSVMILVH